MSSHTITRDTPELHPGQKVWVLYRTGVQTWHAPNRPDKPRPYTVTPAYFRQWPAHSSCPTLTVLYPDGGRDEAWAPEQVYTNEAVAYAVAADKNLAIAQRYTEAARRMLGLAALAKG